MNKQIIRNNSDYETKQRDALKRAESVIMPIFKQNSAMAGEWLPIIDREMMIGLKNSGRNLIQRTIAWGFIRRILIQAAGNNASLYDTEQKIRQSIQKTIRMKTAVQKPLLERAERIYANIREYLCGEELLDYGAGNGIVSNFIARRNGQKVCMMDTVDYNQTGLPLTKITEGQRIPARNKSFDTTICILVLHHSDNPEFILDELVRVTRQRIVIIEGDIDEPESLIMNSFFDWFMNRIGTLTDINVPLNFKTTAQWQALFRQRKLTVVTEKKLGAEPMIREHHVLYALDLPSK